MSTNDIDLILYRNVSQLATLYRQRLANLAEPFHLTGAQLHTLLSLTPGESSPMKNLCVHLSCDPSYITNLIERLVGQGLIERHEATTDRRIKMISLTKKGTELRKLAVSRLPELTSPTLTDKEKVTFADLSKKMLTNRKPDEDTTA